MLFSWEGREILICCLHFSFHQSDRDWKGGGIVVWFTHKKNKILIYEKHMFGIKYCIQRERETLHECMPIKSEETENNYSKDFIS